MDDPTDDRRAHKQTRGGKMNWLSPGRAARRLSPSPALLLQAALALALFALSCSHNTVEGDCSIQSCRFGQRCVAGLCIEESCSGPMDCVSPLSCVEGRCVMSGGAGGGAGGGGGGMCAGPADCPGQRCENGLCVSDDCIEGNVRNCEGPCGSGVQSCIGGVWRTCNSPLPSIEACGGGDEDCDGTIDEGCAPCGEGELRPCQSLCGVGQEQCVGGSWGPCDAPAPDPTTGVCGGSACSEGAQQGCASPCGPGTRRCSGGEWSECLPNDPASCGCAPGAREPCESPCGPGERACIDGSWGSCEPLDPRACGCVEGGTQGCESPIEGCQLVSRCVGGAWGECLPVSDERCGDNLDNDCDVLVDEGCAVDCDPPLMTLSALTEIRSSPFLTIGQIRWAHNAFALAWTESPGAQITYFGRWDRDGRQIGFPWSDEGAVHDLISTGSGFILLRSTFEGLYLDRFNPEGLHQERVGPFGIGEPYSATLSQSGADRLIVAASSLESIELYPRFLNGQSAGDTQVVGTQDIGNSLAALPLPGGALITYSVIESYDPYRSSLFSLSIDALGRGSAPQPIGVGQDGAPALREGVIGLAFTRAELPRPGRSMFLSMGQDGRAGEGAIEVYEDPRGATHSPALLPTRSGFLWGAYGGPRGDGDLFVTSLDPAGRRPGEIQALREGPEDDFYLRLAWDGERVAVASLTNEGVLTTMHLGIYQPRCP